MACLVHRGKLNIWKQLMNFWWALIFMILLLEQWWIVCGEFGCAIWKRSALHHHLGLLHALFEFLESVSMVPLGGTWNMCDICCLLLIFPLGGHETCVIYAICCLYFISFRNQNCLDSSYLMFVDDSTWPSICLHTSILMENIVTSDSTW